MRWFSRVHYYKTHMFRTIIQSKNVLSTQYFNIVLFTLLLIFLSLFEVATASQYQQSSSSPPFETKAFHLMVLPHYEGISYYRDRITTIADHGYNTVILELGSSVHTAYGLLKMGAGNSNNNKSFNKNELAGLITHIRSLQLEPIISVKLIGKMKSTLTGLPVKRKEINATGLLKKYPDLLLKKPNGQYGTVINLSYESGGKDVFDLVLFPLINELLMIFGDQAPKYFLLGIDEIEIDELAVFANKKNQSPAQLFGEAVNRLTRHLIDRNITPVMWGDMFLSTRLAFPGHGVPDFIFNPQFMNSNSYNAEHGAINSQSVLLAIKYLKPDVRKKIIVADWHYADNADGDYPSVDYFQEKGFKDVWGATWFDSTSISSFSRYAAARRCGGMIATTWGSDIASKESNHFFKSILNNSILFFNNPEMLVPENHHFPMKLSVDPGINTVTDKDGVVKILPLHLTKKHEMLDVVITLRADFSPASAELVLHYGGATFRQKQKNGTIVTRLLYDENKHILYGKIPMPKGQRKKLTYIDIRLDLMDKLTGYLTQDYHSNAILISDQPIATANSGATNDTLLGIDFTSISTLTNTDGVLGDGRFGPYLKWGGNSKYRRNPVVHLIDNGLDCRNVDASASIAPQFWSEIKQKGMVLDVSVKLLETPTDDYTPIVTWGNFKSGWRLLLKRNRKLQLQLARAENGYRPVKVQPNTVLELNKWVDIRIVLTPPDSQMSRRISVSVNGDTSASENFTRPIIESKVPFGLGVQYIDRSNPRKQFGNFPGLIKKMTVKTFTKIR